MRRRGCYEIDRTVPRKHRDIRKLSVVACLAKNDSAQENLDELSGG